MASSEQQDWSDSDEDDLSQVETSVLLGIPDGAIESPADLNDAAVSRIGGPPALLSPRVPFDSSYCRHCKDPMQLLVQLWAPLQDSPCDRAVYVWACAKSGCQRMPGSVRAWRGLRYNEDYASRLERKFARKRAHGAAQSGFDACSTHQGVNPFAMSGEMTSATNFGMGSDVFYSFAPPGPSGAITSQVSGSEEDHADSDGDTASTSSSKSLVVALASATLTGTSWDLSPTYAPQYLSTVGEYIPRPKQTPDKDASGTVTDIGADQECHTWTSEKYENSIRTDHVFSRFNERAALESQQCVRYDFGGIPLPFAADDLYKQLFPSLPGKLGSTTVTKSACNVQHPPPKRGYDATSIPSCSHCGSRRVFECQLMPNLINIVGAASSADGDRLAKDDGATIGVERKDVIRKLLKGEVGGRGMEWGTVLVFSCEKDCCLSPDNKEKQDAWREELALVQWDN